LSSPIAPARAPLVSTTRSDRRAATARTDVLDRPVVSGNDYKIRVAGYNGAEGSFIIRADVDTGAPFCIGDGISATPCPCGNNSATSLESGCLNSTGSAGRLTATGRADVSSDTVTLNGTAMPANSTCLFFQGTAKQGSGFGAVFGDGLRCAAGTVIRLASDEQRDRNLELPDGPRSGRTSRD
jgi:hypothetical protein